MSRTYIPSQLRRRVREDAGHRCGYCRISEFVSATELVIDHIVPESAGGPTVRENLFGWSEDGTEVIGRTGCGRATVEALRLNRELAILARRRWVSVGWHPPED